MSRRPKTIIPTAIIPATALGCLPPDSPQPRPIDSYQQAMLDYYDPRYDTAKQMLWLDFKTPGYHSGFSSGAQVHPTRESLIYALALLQRDKPGDAERAARIVQSVLRLQDTDTDSPTYGVWP